MTTLLAIGHLPRPTLPSLRAVHYPQARKAWCKAIHGAVINLDHLHTLAYVPQVCFDKVCQASADRAFVAALVVPVLVAAAVIAWSLQESKKARESGRVFEDPKTGTTFEAPDGVSPDKDEKGELTFRPISYTPWPVEEGAEGERLRVNVGRVGQPTPRTFLFEKTLPQPSVLVTVTLPRPLGLIIEEDAPRRRAVVGGVVEGSRAEQKMRLAQFDRSKRAEAALEGDVVRAFTCTNLVWPAKSLAFGAKPPQRHTVLYGADGQRWPKVAAALKQGLVEDGPVTFVLERRVEPAEGRR